MKKLPQPGQYLRDKLNNGKRRFKVAGVYPGSDSHPAMILEWPDPDSVTGRRGQVFTTRDWQDRWEVVKTV